MAERGRRQDGWRRHCKSSSAEYEAGAPAIRGIRVMSSNVDRSIRLGSGAAACPRGLPAALSASANQCTRAWNTRRQICPLHLRLCCAAKEDESVLSFPASKDPWCSVPPTQRPVNFNASQAFGLRGRGRGIREHCSAPSSIQSVNLNHQKSYRSRSGCWAVMLHQLSQLRPTYLMQHAGVLSHDSLRSPPFPLLGSLVSKALYRMSLS